DEKLVEIFRRFDTVFESIRAVANAAADEALEAFLRYGDHLDECQALADDAPHVCDCGFSKKRKAAHAELASILAARKNSGGADGLQRPSPEGVGASEGASASAPSGPVTDEMEKVFFQKAFGYQPRKEFDDLAPTMKVSKLRAALKAALSVRPQTLTVR